MIDYKQLSDLELLILVKEDDKSAFGELYLRYKEPLFFHASRMLEDSESARDIVQDIFAAIWSKREILVVPEAVDAYLYGSIRNRILNFIAHQKVVSRYTDSIDQFLAHGISPTDEAVREKELTRIIEREITLLPQKMREVFELSRKEELTYKQIADRLGLSEHTVKKQAQRAIRILRLKIKINIFFTFFPW